MNFTLFNGVVNAVGKAIDRLSTDSTKKEQLKSQISSELLKYLDSLTEAQQKIITQEANGNFLQRSWRPIVMLTFTLIVVLGIFIDIPLLKDGSPFWNLLELGLGGYVIGRSAEKITTTTFSKHKK